MNTFYIALIVFSDNKKKKKKEKNQFRIILKINFLKINNKF